MINNDSNDALEQAVPPSAAASPQHLVVPNGWKLVPVQPTPEIIAGAAIASWPTATLADIELARLAAPLVLMKMDMAPGTTVDALAGMLATMAPAYRAMLAAVPAPPAAAHADAKATNAQLVRAGLALMVNLKTTKDELESLKGDAKDAERYRWLRAGDKDGALLAFMAGHSRVPADVVDSRIDAAIAAGELPVIEKEGA